MELAGRYSKQSALLHHLVSASTCTERFERPAEAGSSTPAQAGGKKLLTSEEAATIVAKYEAGASLAQLRVEHQMAKRTVSKLLRENGTRIRPRGGQSDRTQTVRQKPNGSNSGAAEEGG